MSAININKENYNVEVLIEKKNNKNEHTETLKAIKK